MNLSLRRAILYLLILTFGFTGMSFARYHTVITNFGAENSELPSIEFSTWVLDYDGGEGIEVGNMKPGDVIQRQIVVHNWKEVAGEEVISEYDQRVWLELCTTANLPLTFAMSESGQTLSLSPYGESTYRSGDLAFGRDVKQSRTIDLEITWPGDIRDEYYKHEIDYLELSITGTQSTTYGSGGPNE